jgi:hypothetical protein
MPATIQFHVSQPVMPLDEGGICRKLLPPNPGKKIYLFPKYCIKQNQRLHFQSTFMLNSFTISVALLYHTLG